MAPQWSGRRCPNMSDFLRDLNLINNDRDLDEFDFNFEEALAMITNAHFFDSGSGQNTDYQALAVQSEIEPVAPSAVVSTTDELASLLGDFTDLDFITSACEFGEFDWFSYLSVPPAHECLGNLQNLQPITLPNHASPVPRQWPQLSSYDRLDSVTGDITKRRASVSTQRSRSLSFEEEEVDRRKRNTAASARFRIKKKQREMALEKEVTEMSEKVTKLEKRITLLETENNWLQDLIIEKSNGNKEFAAKLKEFNLKNKASKADDKSSGSSGAATGKK
ncbi:Fc.00g073460.m01.CDS01 [Cosmosporella sp. VM-42]